MARIWAKHQYDDDCHQQWDGHIERFSKTAVEISFMDTLSSPSWVGVATGQFRLSATGEVTGTLTGYTFSYKETVTYSFSGASLSAGRLFRLMESDSPNLMAYVLSQSDRIDIPGGSSGAHGFAGNDTINGSADYNEIWGNSGSDVLRGAVGNDTLRGGFGHDLLQGDSGNDVLVGGAGSDTMFGGYGPDRFVFTSADDSPPDFRDRVRDFHRPDGDIIDFSSMDADLVTAGNQSFRLIGTQRFGHVAGELRWQVTEFGLNITADQNGDGRADFALFLAEVGNLRSGDVIL